MNKSKYAKTIFFYIILIIGVWYGPAQSQPTSGTQSIAQRVGRENPFAKIPRAVKPVSPAALAPSQYVEEPSELFVETIILKFLDAKSLKNAIGNMPSSYGSIATNEKNNSLIVCDTKEYLERIVSEIKKADKTPQQIMVEVVILDVQLDNDTEIGINWDLLSDNTYDIGYRQNFTTRLGSTIEDEANVGNATAFNTTGLGGNFSLISGTIRNVVHLIQEKRNVEILASPRVMMVSGETANIQAIDEIPYTETSSTSQGGTLTYTQFKPVGIKLQVSATLTDGNDILLTVDAEQNVQVGTTTPPRVDTRKANTSLLLKDEQVVVFGGLRRQEKTREVSQIPFLGDLPIIGEIFKSTNVVIKNSELIVFLAPHIYKEGEPIPEDAMAKFKEIKNRPIPSLEKDKDAKKAAAAKEEKNTVKPKK
jgi:type II secretory pathway component GspD/PulD (secretin)